ncbi:autotransporter outer membrane beta-barrel domain-containing protein [Achromobacter sp. UMC46]|nr:autotransporter outer membrane beta-barrel domain-containing protein [Achromobacter sp. UMC46]
MLLSPALLPGLAAAACSPTTSPGTGQSVTCTGATASGSVEAAAGSQNVSITVAPGASFITNATRAFSVEDASTIVNNGTITVQGGSGSSRGAMVGFGNNNTLINNGSIAMAGALVRGISVPNTGSTGTRVTNAGSIVTSGTSGHGIAVNGPGNLVTNTGTVDVSGTDAKGVFLQGGSGLANVLINSGSIRARGASSNGTAGADGVYVNTTNPNGFFSRVENLPGGSIIADHSYAYRGHNGNDTFINAGYVEGYGGASGNTAVFMGPQGTGTLILRTGSVIRGVADGGGAASNAYLEGQGVADNAFTNFRTLTMRGEQWRWTSDSTFTDSISLQSGTFFLTGTLGSPANSLAAGAVLAGTGTFAGALNNAGEIRPGPNDGTGFGALTVRGNYVGAGGSLTLNTQLGADNSPSDRLVIDGGQASGATPITVVNRGGAGALTAADGIAVVQAVNGATTNTGAFSLATPLTAGAYDYHLYRGGALGGDPDSWFLRSRGYAVDGQVVGSLPEAEAIAAEIAGQTGGEAPAIASVNFYRPEVALYSAIPMVARQVGLTQLSTFHDRQGDQDLLRRDGARSSGWARGFGGSFKEALDGDAQPAFDGDLTGLQIGQDLYARTGDTNTQDRLGLFAGYTHARGDVTGSVSGRSNIGAGRLTVDGYSLGGYWTRIGASGWYVDSVLMNTWLDIDTDSKAQRTASTNGSTFTASVETGMPFPVSQNWRLEPQAQILYQRTRVDDFEDDVSPVSISNDNALTGRIGVRLQGAYESAGTQWRPYARANLWRTFSGTNRVVLGSDGVDTPRSSTALEFALGVTAQMTDRMGFYGKVSYTTSVDSGYVRGTAGQLGVRYAW